MLAPEAAKQAGEASPAGGEALVSDGVLPEAALQEEVGGEEGD